MPRPIPRPEVIGAQLGARGHLANDYQWRSQLRSWAQGKMGLSYREIASLSLKDLVDAYNDNTDKTFISLTHKLKTGEKTEMKTAVKELDDNTKAGALIAEALQSLHLKTQIDETEVRRIAQEEVNKAKQRERIIILDKRKDQETKKDIGQQHYVFPLLLKALESGLHVALVGSAGTGKTTAAHKVAEALGIGYECQSFSGTTTKSDLLGFVDANGNYRDTAFRRAFIAGHLWCGDEFDAGNANANVVINSATANGVCAFPDGMKEKHKDFKVVICMNTYGSGANRQYVGRNQLDAATMDRFAFIAWDIDTALESSFLGVPARAMTLDLLEGGLMSNAQWLDRVQKVRNAVEALNIRHLITPRASLFGAALFAHGVGRKHVEEMVLRRGLDQEQWNRIINKVGA